MPQPLTPFQVEQYREDGYTIAPRFFDSRMVKAMQLELDRLHSEGKGVDVCPLPGRQNIQFTPLDQMSALFREIPFHPLLVQALSQLIGDPLILWLDQIYLKPAFVGNGNSWHEDNARFKVPDVALSAGAWIAIHDATRGNGTLELVPGSFRDSRLEVAFRMPTPQEESEAVAAEMEAGGVAFFNFGTLHCTRDNVSDRARAAAAYHFLRGDNRPGEQFLAFGKNVPVSAADVSGAQWE